MVYATPSLARHYVLAHGYRPPDEFITAVLAWDETAPRLSQDELWARTCKLMDPKILSLNRRSSCRIAPCVVRSTPRERLVSQFTQNVQFWCVVAEPQLLIRNGTRVNDLPCCLGYNEKHPFSSRHFLDALMF